MKKMMLVLFVLFATCWPSFAEEFIPPARDGSGVIGGRSNEAWRLGIFEGLILNGVAYTLPAADGGASTVLSTDGSGALSWASAGASTAWDDIADPDGAGTVAMTTFAQILTSTKTDGDMFNFQGLGAFGDVSVVRIESKTGNPTDGTVLEVVSHDANVDPLVVSTSGQAGVLTVNQGGTVSIIGATGITGTVSATTGASLGSSTNSTLRTDTVTLTSQQVKALRATPFELVASPGADKFIEVESIVFVLEYGSEGLTESTDNLVAEYGTSNVDATATIETTGFIDQTADMIAVIPGATQTAVAATNMVNNNLELFNSGDGEIAGNASNDTTLMVKTTYRVHTGGL